MAELTLENLEIGGRNLLPDTDFTSSQLTVGEKYGFNSVTIYTSNYGSVQPYEGRKYLLAYSGNPGDNYFYLNPIISINKSQTYTLSFVYCSAGGVNGNSSFLYFDNGQHLPISFVPLKSGWTKAQFTFTAPANANTLQIRFGINNNANAWLAVSSIKLEKGNVATDWSPAPEDFYKNSIIGTVTDDNVDWQSPTGLYLSQYPTSSSLIAHFYLGSGSCPAFQLKVLYGNGAIYYRSARDSHGFEKPWEKLSNSSDIPFNALTTDRIFVQSAQPSNPQEGDIWFKR